MEISEVLSESGDENIIEKKKCVTLSIAEQLENEEVFLKTTLKELIVYSFFLISLAIYAYGVIHPQIYGLTSQLYDKFINSDNKFEDIKSAEHFWQYIENDFINHMYNVDLEQKVLFNNVVLGVPRMRQVRVRSLSCSIHHYFTRHFVDCFGSYWSNSVDDLAFGLGTGTAWVYTSEGETKSLPYSGTIAKYEGGGFYVDFNVNKDATTKLIADLKSNRWIDQGTSAVFVDFAVFNANLNLFSIIKLCFEFPPVGGVITASTFQTLHFARFSYHYDMIFLLCELITLLFLFIFFCLEIRDMIFFKWNYLFFFWKYVELLLIMTGFTSAILSLMIYLPLPETLNDIINNPTKYGNLEYISKLKATQIEFFAFELFLACIKVFKYLGITKFLGQVNHTLNGCVADVLGFSVMFFLIFNTYAEMGYLLFGSKVLAFSTFGGSMFSLFAIILGDFDYNEIEKVDFFLAPIFFISFMYIVQFILINMFLAIIDDTYGDVKTEMQVASDEKVQMIDHIKGKLHGFFLKFGYNSRCIDPDDKSEFHVPTTGIKRDLEKLEFADEEINVYFSKINMNPENVKEINVIDLTQERKQSAEKEKKPTLLHINELIEQQDVLENIEAEILLLNDKTELLMNTLGNMKNVSTKRNI